MSALLKDNLAVKSTHQYYFIGSDAEMKSSVVPYTGFYSTCISVGEKTTVNRTVTRILAEGTKANFVSEDGSLDAALAIDCISGYLPFFKTILSDVCADYTNPKNLLLVWNFSSFQLENISKIVAKFMGRWNSGDKSKPELLLLEAQRQMINVFRFLGLHACAETVGADLVIPDQRSAKSFYKNELVHAEIERRRKSKTSKGELHKLIQAIGTKGIDFRRSRHQDDPSRLHKLDKVERKISKLILVLERIKNRLSLSSYSLVNIRALGLKYGLSSSFVDNLVKGKASIPGLSFKKVRATILKRSFYRVEVNFLAIQIKRAKKLVSCKHHFKFQIDQRKPHEISPEGTNAYLTNQTLCCKFAGWGVDKTLSEIIELARYLPAISLKQVVQVVGSLYKNRTENVGIWGNQYIPPVVNFLNELKHSHTDKNGHFNLPNAIDQNIYILNPKSDPQNSVLKNKIQNNALKLTSISAIEVEKGNTIPNKPAALAAIRKYCVSADGFIKIKTKNGWSFYYAGMDQVGCQLNVKIFRDTISVPTTLGDIKYSKFKLPRQWAISSQVKQFSKFNHLNKIKLLKSLASTSKKLQLTDKQYDVAYQNLISDDPLVRSKQYRALVQAQNISCPLKALGEYERYGGALPQYAKTLLVLKTWWKTHHLEKAGYFIEFWMGKVDDDRLSEVLEMVILDDMDTKNSHEKYYINQPIDCVLKHMIEKLSGKKLKHTGKFHGYKKGSKRRSV